MSFVNLHNHSYYSLLDGLPKADDYVAKALEHGSPGVALTDHGVLYGAVEFYMAAKKKGINPIIGCEMYLTPYSRHSRNAAVDTKRYHLILLSKTNRGYQNLIQLVTKAHLEGMYYKPRIDWELLEEYHHDLIALSACLGGEIPQTILAGKKEEEVLEVIKKYQNVFGAENFFLEIQSHFHLPEQLQVNKTLIGLSRHAHIPIVATSDAHYVNRDDNVAQDVLLCIQTDKRIDDPARLTMMAEDCSLHSPQDMAKHFPEVPEALSNTLEIEKMCKVELALGKNLMPSFPMPGQQSPQEFLRELCYRGLLERYSFSLSDTERMTLEAVPGDAMAGKSLGDLSNEQMQEVLEASYSLLKKEILGKLTSEQQGIINRLEFELLVIHQMHFDTYFLIVQDFVLWAKNQGISVGPGRGSVGGSLVAYSLKITDLDPLRYNLLFERFLNPARISMPDIDMDFADTRRDEVIEYVRQKYGRDHVAQISTFGTMAAKQAVKDAGRAVGIPFAEMNEVVKLIPDKPGTKLKETLETQADFKKLYDSNPLYKKIFDIALKIEGAVRHISVHACAVVIADEPLTAYTALQNPPNNKDTIITQLSAKPLEYLGLLKMDFLGLRNLSIIQKALHIIERTQGRNIDITTIPLEDKKTFELFTRGDTTGVFQFESPGMKRYLKDLKPTQFEDIIAMVALYRPGPMEWIPDYIAYKHGKKKVHYPHQELAEILKDTYGIAIYQEQIMQIVQKFAGFALGEADLLRRAIGKKIVAELMAQKEKFVEKAKAKGHSETEALFIFERVIEPFAHYGFNKSHAACYALISYQTAYLKAHYATEFMAALMSSDAEDMDRIAIDVEEAQRMGIKVLPPSVNESLSNFTVVEKGLIRFGLKAIKGLGEGTVERILDERKAHDRFKDVFDFVVRVSSEHISRKSLEALTFSGAMDEWGSRNALSSVIEILLDYAKQTQAKNRSGQSSLFGGMEEQHVPSLPIVPAESNLQKLQWEKAYLGLYVSGHPLDGLKKYFGKKASLIDSIEGKDVGKTHTVMGLIVRLRKIFTKNKDTMLSMTLEDPTGAMEVMVFPKAFKLLNKPLEQDMLIIVNGRLDRRNNEFLISSNEIRIVDLSMVITKATEEKFFDPSQKVVRAKVESNWEDDEEEMANADPAMTTIVAPAPMFIEKEVVQDFTIELPYNCSKEKILDIKKILESVPAGTQDVFLNMQGKKIKTNYKINPDDQLTEQIRNVTGASNIASSS